MDKSWITCSRSSNEYIAGVEMFLDFAFGNVQGVDEIMCPCKKCNNCNLFSRSNVFEHLIVFGFNPTYDVWNYHGESFNSVEYPNDEPTIERTLDDDMEAMFRDVFPYIREQEEEGVEDFVVREDGVEDENHYDDDTNKIKALLKDGQQPLYEGCTGMTMISFLIRLFTLKCINGWSNESYNQLLKLLILAFPKDAKISKSYEETRGVVRLLGLEYRKIDAYENDCMLFWKEAEDADFCYVCGRCRWITVDEKVQEDKKGKNKAKQPEEPFLVKLPNGRKVAKKILRHFPLVSRLKRMYMCSKTASDMRWHEEGHKDDDRSRHPSDGLAWKDFKSRNSEFAAEPRNVMMGLSSDGFSPYKTMSISYSMWPVALVVYNLPPWMCMKPAYTILSLLIPGPTSPKNNIDIFLQPLIDELNLLWVEGVETYDSYVGDRFVMHAALLWTISDYPAYAMLSGYSTKGKLACPYCNYNTCGQWLKHSSKVVYLGHRKFLPPNHRWRKDRRSFNGEREYDEAPKPMSGCQIYDELRHYEPEFGKRLKQSNGRYPFKKRSIFFDLPYWKYNLLRHNLDIMHIEKNIVDSILGTLLNLPGKTKDHLSARRDLQEMGIRPELFPVPVPGNKFHLPPACFSLGKKEKDIFCRVLKSTKFPTGYASNISRCVNEKNHTISGLKTHDCHFLLHYLIPIAVRKILPKHVAGAIIRLCTFFREICSKVLKFEDFDRMEEEIIETICQLEMIFPPSFFDIMMHLPIHLVNEARLGGPATYRWMYSPERYLLDLKNMVRNRSQPEGSIAEGYIAKEASTFCSRYLGEDATTRFNRPWSRYGVVETQILHGRSMFPTLGTPIGGTHAFIVDKAMWDRAHRYVLFNTPEIASYTRDYEILFRGMTGVHVPSFHDWFATTIRSSHVSGDIQKLSYGPLRVAKRFKGWAINGYRFRTEARDLGHKTQNSGVTLVAATQNLASSSNPTVEDVTYFGVVQDIIELDYHGQFSIVLFECKWFRTSYDCFQFPIVDSKRLIFKDDPFVFASQVKQVFFVEDPISPKLRNVLRVIPRDTYDLEEIIEEGGVATFWSDEFNPRIDGRVERNDEIIPCTRGDVLGRIVDANSVEVDDN